MSNKTSFMTAFANMILTLMGAFGLIVFCLPMSSIMFPIMVVEAEEDEAICTELSNMQVREIDRFDLGVDEGWSVVIKKVANGGQYEVKMPIPKEIVADLLSEEIEVEGVVGSQDAEVHVQKRGIRVELVVPLESSIRMRMKDESISSTEIHGLISFMLDNEVQYIYHDRFAFYENEPFNTTYYGAGTTVLTTNPDSVTHEGIRLSNEIVLPASEECSGGVLIDKDMLSEIGYDDESDELYIVFRIQTEYVRETSNLVQRMRVLGSEEWKQGSVVAENGDIVEVMITYTNYDKVLQNNVVIKDSLDESLKRVSSTVKIYSLAYPEGRHHAESALLDNWIDLGECPPGEKITLYYRARVVENVPQATDWCFVRSGRVLSSQLMNITIT